MDAACRRDPARKIDVPDYLREVIEEIAFQARDDKRVDASLLTVGDGLMVVRKR